ncbi:MAG: dTDP-4-dehydrorhamnose 3,5-epimerase family protein [Candidatus Peribacteraceae bacterium]|nr:dTDP-4-dehydrorhamnose 3,5-epimerase family protein [Candidatus Peribacteraceae bacterium]
MKNNKQNISGIEFKHLKTHGDRRGYFREIIRSSDPFFENEGFAQWSHSHLFQGVIKAWHYHEIQTDYWYVASGIIRVGLCDMRKDSSTFQKTMDFFMGDLQQPTCLKIPPGIAHGCKAVQGPANLFYVMDREYNPNDEHRLPFNDLQINFDWNKDYEIT